LRDPISKTLHKNRTGIVAQGEGPKFKPRTTKKKKFLKRVNPLFEAHNVVEILSDKKPSDAQRSGELRFYFVPVGPDGYHV
jgi:hypothetical protein